MSALFSHLVSRSGSAFAQRTTLTFARTSTRAASTQASETAAKKGGELSQKAQQGWSQIVKAAGPAAQGAVQSMKKLGGPAGKVVSFVECRLCLLSVLRLVLSLGMYGFGWNTDRLIFDLE